LCSPTAVRTALRKPSAPIGKPALTLSAHLQASMIHATPMAGNEKLWRGCVRPLYSRGLIAIRQSRRHRPRGHCGAELRRMGSRRVDAEDCSPEGRPHARSELISAPGTRACP
jgi:hypothetical protein